jgi:hypothetical protein
MGECAYYFKAQFKDDKTAKLTKPLMQQFLLEAQKAYSFWQGHRGDTDAKKFWREFSKDFPMTTAYAKEAKLYGKPQEKLSGHLDFGQDENDVQYLNLSGSELGYCATNVWHFADWSDLANFIKTYFKAIKVVVASEEDGCGSLESLNLYEYEEIVKALVKHVNSLRDGGMLAARIKKIHPDLKALLEQ